MSTSTQSWEMPSSAALMGQDPDPGNWYAVQTRPRHERVVANKLCERGLSTFYPTITEVHRWSDRKKTVEMPLFNCYVFVKLTPTNEDRQKVLRVDSVLGFAGNPGWGTPIPSEQIEAVRVLISERLPYACHPFLKAGERVRICSGALDGMEGILVGRKGDRKLIISVDAMQRSLAVQVDGYDVEPV